MYIAIDLDRFPPDFRSLLRVGWGTRQQLRKLLKSGGLAKWMRKKVKDDFHCRCQNVFSSCCQVFAKHCQSFLVWFLEPASHYLSTVIHKNLKTVMWGDHLQKWLRILWTAPGRIESAAGIWVWWAAGGAWHERSFSLHPHPSIKKGLLIKNSL